MDTRKVRQHLVLAGEILREKGAPTENTAAGQLLLAVVELVKQIDNSLGETHKVKPK